MNRVNIRKRVISRAICRYCQSTNEVWFDVKHDEYLCVNCLLLEREKIAMLDEDDEDQMQDRLDLKNKE